MMENDMPTDPHLPALLAFWRAHDALPPTQQAEFRARFARSFGPAFTAAWMSVRPSA